MANKDVELRIRARDYSQKPLKAVAKAIDEMSKAQEAQRKAAERGEISTRDLEAAYKKLESAGNQLLKLNSLIEVFKRQNQAMTEAAAKSETLRQKQKELETAYRNTANVTAKQEREMARVNRQVESASKSQATQAERVAKTTRELERYGIETSKIGQAQSGIVNSVSQVNTVLARQDEIISNAGAASAQAKVIAGLRQQADQAIATANGYQTLGRVVQVATGQLGPLGTQIQEIISPAEAARRSLAGMEKQVEQVSSVLARNSKEVENVAQKVRMLNEVNKSVSGLAQQIDLFRQQVSTLRSARTEYQNAKRDVVALAQQMRSATTDTGELGNRMQQAQQRLAGAASALRNTANAARSTQAALRGAGVDTRNLADAETRLIGTSERSANALNTLAAATNKAAAGARDGSKAFSLFESNGRTTLSFVQRMRGEVLALASAYVGFQGAMNLAGGAVDAFKVRQQALVKIGVVVGTDQSKINAEWAYMQGLAEKLGISIETVAQSYTKFAVSAKAVGLSMNESKFIYESVAKAGRVYHLSADDMNGVFRALEQMLSKGQVYAEELRGQLGERLPAAVAMFAEGTGRTIPELIKALEKGEVSGKEVVNFAQAQSKAIDAQLATAEKGVDAMEARAQNAMFNFKLALADSGFIEQYVIMLEKIAKALASPDGQEAAKKLGVIFGQISQAVVWAIDNIDSLMVVLGALAGLQVARVLAGWVRGFKELLPYLKNLKALVGGVIGSMSSLGASMAAAGGAIGVAGVALKGLARLIPVVGWALTAWSIGEIMYDQSQTFREAVNAVVRDFKHLGNQLLAVGESIPAAIYDMLMGILRPITTTFAGATKAIADWIADVLSLIPGVGEGLAQMARSVGEDLTKEHRSFMESTGKIWNEVDKNWAKLNNDMVDKNSEAAHKIIRNMNDSLAAVLNLQKNAAGGFSYTELAEGGGVSARDREVNALTKQMEKLEEASKKADIAARKAAQRKNLSGRLAMIDEEFAPDYARAKGIGGDEGAALTKRLDAVVAARKKAESTLYASQQRTTSGVNKQANALDALIQKYKDLEAAVGVKEAKTDPNASFDDRLAAKIAAVNTQYDKLIEKSNKLGTGGKKLGQDFEELRQRNIELATSQAKMEELKRVEDEMNAQLNTKKNLMEEIQIKREAGIISEDEAVSQSINLQMSMNGQIDATSQKLAELALRFKESMPAEEFSRIMAQLAAVQAGTQKLTNNFKQMHVTVVQGALDGLSTGISSIVTEMSQVVAGAQSIGDAFTNLGVATAKFFADFLQKIATAILQQLLLNALAGMTGFAGGGIAGAATSLGGVAKKHNGGIVGSSTTGGMQTAGGISPALFANAPRFHSGGLPGLKSDEVPTILQKGEQVLSKNDPNNILNQTGGGGQTAATPPSQRFVLVDDRSRIPEAMNTPEGEEAIMIALRRNVPTLKSLVGK